MSLLPRKPGGGLSIEREETPFKKWARESRTNNLAEWLASPPENIPDETLEYTKQLNAFDLIIPSFKLSGMDIPPDAQWGWDMDIPEGITLSEHVEDFVLFCRAAILKLYWQYYPKHKCIYMVVSPYVLNFLVHCGWDGCPGNGCVCELRPIQAKIIFNMDKRQSQDTIYFTASNPNDYPEVPDDDYSIIGKMKLYNLL